MKRLRPLAFLLWLPALAARAAGWMHPYEELRFHIRWLFIPAGTAVIRQYWPDPEHVRFRMDSCSNATLDLVYPVRDRIRVRARRNPGDRPALRSQRYEYSQREGRDRSELVLEFPAPGVIRMEDRLAGTTRTFHVVPETVDMVTAFFLTRGLPLVTGKTYRIPVFDKGKAYALEIEVVRREVLHTVLGKNTATVMVHPRLQSEGVFKRTGELYLWLTDDARRIPVRMESSVRIGKMITTLASVQRRDSAPVRVPDPPYLCLSPGKPEGTHARDASGKDRTEDEEE